MKDPPIHVEGRYFDSEGRECDLATMCVREPGWAANRLAWETAERKKLEQSRDALQLNNEKMRKCLHDLKWLLSAEGRFETASIDEALR